MTLETLDNLDHLFDAILESIPRDHPILGTYTIPLDEDDTLTYTLLEHGEYTILQPDYYDHQNSFSPIIFRGTRLDPSSINEFYNDLINNF